MRFSILAIATTLALVSAQDLSKVPSCAIPCFATAVQGSGCGLTDVKCQCTTGKDKITASLLQCTPARCNADDLTKVTSAVLSLCADAGVTITSIPAAVASATAGMNGSMSMSASRSASASPAAATTNAAAASYVGAGAIAMGVLGAIVL